MATNIRKDGDVEERQTDVPITGQLLREEKPTPRLHSILGREHRLTRNGSMNADRGAHVEDEDLFLLRPHTQAYVRGDPVPARSFQSVL